MNLLVTGARAPVAADIARALASAGHRVWVADSVRYPVAAASPWIVGSVRLPSPRTDFLAFRTALAGVCLRQSIECIVPSVEEIFWLAGAASHLPPGVRLRASPLPVLKR